MRRHSGLLAQHLLPCAWYLGEAARGVPWLVSRRGWMSETVGAGYTPLHMAVGYSHVAVAAALLEAGADPEVRWNEAARDVLLV